MVAAVIVVVLVNCAAVIGATATIPSLVYTALAAGKDAIVAAAINCRFYQG